MGRPATKECVCCHHRYPVTRMHKTNQTVNSGHSVGASFNPSRKQSTRIGARNHYRNKIAWICNDCWPSYRNGQITWALVKLALVGSVIYFLFFNN